MAERPEKGEISTNKQMAMIVVLVLFISSALPQVTLGNVSRDHWPHLGAPVTQDLLDELVYDDILNKPLAVGFFLRGAAGPKGPDGPRGPQGTQGVQGYTGLPGATGPKGKQGPPGIIGPRGPPGLHGLQGIKGMRGPMGPPGPSGAPGTQGAPGSAGGSYSPALVLVINTTTICEGGNDALLCGDKKIIKITQAFWGRDNYYTCAQPPSSTMTSNQLTQMDPDHVTRTLKYRCTNKQNCPISANRLTFGDTSDPTVAKYLRVWYECIPDHRDFLMKDNVVRRYRRDIARSKEKREFFLPVIDKTKEKNEHSRDVSEAEKEWDKSNEQSNKTTERTKIEKRQNSRRDNAKLSHILNELLHPASSLPT